MNLPFRARQHVPFSHAQIWCLRHRGRLYVTSAAQVGAALCTHYDAVFSLRLPGEWPRLLHMMAGANYV